MSMGFSTLPRMQASSQGWLQTRPQTLGKGFSCLMSLRASLYLPTAMRAT